MAVMKKFGIALLMIFLLQHVSLAQDNLAELARQAETAYANGDFRSSAKLYQQLVDDGARRSDVYYNLGTTYYRAGELGEALLNYRRAEDITPRDDELRLNMARIRVQRVDGLVAANDFWDQIVGLTQGSFSLFELSLICVILFWCLCGSTIAYMLRRWWRKRLRWVILVSAILFIMVTGLAIGRVLINTSLKPAVVIADSVSVMAGPGYNYPVIYELHAAAEIRIVEAQNGWLRFRLPDLREGWVQEKAIGVI